MYAVIETGGKQYRVEVGTELEVELLDVEPGKTVTIDRVLLVADGDESVSAEVVSQTRGPKLISFKYRPKARSRVKKGHRQELTLLRIADITLGGKSAAKDAKKVDDQAKAERLRLEEAAATQAAKDAELAAKLAVGAEAEPKAKSKAAAKPKAETKTESKADTKTESKADTTAESAAEAKTEGKTATPKRTTAKADADAPEADAPEAKAETPKKPRATKKDE
jgi:large subunit ribosomal protein L21